MAVTSGKPSHMKISTLAAAFAFGLFAAGSAYADDTPKPAAPAVVKPAATPAPAAAAAAKPDSAAKAAKSADCYKQADVKGLHGKERKKFHHECMKAM